MSLWLEKARAGMNSRMTDGRWMGMKLLCGKEAGNDMQGKEDLARWPQSQDIS